MQDSVPFETPKMGEPRLLTPGPLTTSFETKSAMLADWGSRDEKFRAMTADLRRRLLAVAGAGDRFDCVPMQGSGTFSVEAMLGTFIGPDDHALVLSNGAYGKRACQILQRIGRRHTVIDKGELNPPRAGDVGSAVSADPSITHVFAVHCETTTGLLNPLEEIAAAAADRNLRLLVDSMSAFGAVPFDAESIRFDAMVSSSNKCLEGVPGFGFVIADRAALAESAGNCHSVSLDVHAQWQGFETGGQWRFTPPTHAVAALLAALDAHEREGGVCGRHQRYSRNWEVIVSGLRGLGFETLLEDRWMAPVIVTFLAPEDSAFDYRLFYDSMNRNGFVLYPGKLTEFDTFRIGCIGHIDQRVMQSALEAMEMILTDMGVSSGAPPQSVLDLRARLTGSPHAR